MFKKTLISVAMMVGLLPTANALLAVPHAPECISYTYKKDSVIYQKVAYVINTSADLEASLKQLVTEGYNPVIVAQGALAYGVPVNIVLKAIPMTSSNFKEYRLVALSCGADPTKLVPAAGFGGFNSYPNLTVVPQSLGGDAVSPS